MLPARPTNAVASALLTLLLCLSPDGARAHGGRLPFDEWGGFAGEALRCQRVIAAAAADCAAGAWAARRACRAAALAGGTCDQAATEAQVAAVRGAALDAIDAHCGERQAIDLQYLGTFDLQDDVISFCRAWEDAAESAVFDHPGAAAGACTAAAAEAVDAIMHQALRGRRRCMDRIAASPPRAAARPALLAGVERRLAAAVERAAARLAARCPEFAARYDRSPRAFVDTLAARADCVGGAFYIQDAVLCAPPVCGNAVLEPTEECDDGNLVAGDGCSAQCAAE